MTAAPLPGDAILLHLGFHKTGTTFLQSTFASSREALLGAGVLYPGRRRSHHPAAYAVTNRSWGGHRATGGGTAPDMRAWQRLARAATEHPGRVLISSESFSLTPRRGAEQMLADLGPTRVHVIFTMRAVPALLASSWQQYLKGGMELTYAEWLEGIVAELDPGAKRTGFWRRNDYPAIVGMWVDLLGPDRVHVVCPSRSDRDLLLRTFEELLAVPSGLLEASPGGAGANRSLTAAEAELLRSTNVLTSAWDWPTYRRTIRNGLVTGMVEGRLPAPDEAPLRTPQHVVDRVAEYGRAAAERLAELGVVVHGDLGILGEPVAGAIGDPSAVPTDVPIEAAIASILGAIRGAQRLGQETAAAEAGGPQAAGPDSDAGSDPVGEGAGRGSTAAGPSGRDGADGSGTGAGPGVGARDRDSAAGRTSSPRRLAARVRRAARRSSR